MCKKKQWKQPKQIVTKIQKQTEKEQSEKKERSITMLN